MNYCGFNIKPFCSDVCGDHRCPQTLAEMCRNMVLDIFCGFRAVAARKKHSVLILSKLRNHLYEDGPVYWYMYHVYLDLKCSTVKSLI